MHIPPVELPTLYKMIGSYTAFIMNKEIDKTGTGTLMKYRDRVFVLTAKHVLEGAVDDKIIISFGTPLSTSIDKVIYRHPVLDLAYIELRERQVELVLGMNSKYFETEEVSYTRVPRVKGVGVVPCCGVGLPAYLQKMREEENTLYAWTLFFSGELEMRTVLPKPLRHIHYDPANEAWMNMAGNEFYDEHGKQREYDIPPFGLSGSAIWLFNPETMNHSKPVYSLLGIQSGAIVQRRYLKIVGVRQLFKEIDQSDPAFKTRKEC